MSSRSKTLVKLALAKAQKDTLELLAIPRYESQTTLPEEREKAIKGWKDLINSEKLKNEIKNVAELSCDTFNANLKKNIENISDQENKTHANEDVVISLNNSINFDEEVDQMLDKNLSNLCRSIVLEESKSTTKLTTSNNILMKAITSPLHFTLPIFYEDEFDVDDPQEISLLSNVSLPNFIDNTVHSLEEDNPENSDHTIFIENNSNVPAQNNPENSNTNLIENSFNVPAKDKAENCNNTNHSSNTTSKRPLTEIHYSLESENVTQPSITSKKIRKRRPDLKDDVYFSITKKNKTDQKHRVYDKRHVCFYCHERKSKMTRHLISNHAQEINVAKCLAMPINSKKRNEEFLKILRMGDFFHNCEVLEKKEGELILVRRPSDEEAMFLSPCDYGPCPQCAGFMIKKHLWLHMKTCFLTKNTDGESESIKSNIIVQSNALVASAIYSPGDKEFKENVLDKLKDDERGTIAKEDTLIRDFGLVLFQKHSDTQCELVRQSMRQCARLVIELRDITNLHSACLDEFIRPSHFDNIIRAVRNICKGTETENGVPSLALKIGFHLQKCAGILRGRFLRAGYLQSDDSTRRFLELYNLEWQDKISARALNDIRNNKMNVANALPLTNDLMKLNLFVKSQMEFFKTKLSQNRGKETWLDLAKLVLCRIVLFNKKRAGEASKMRISDFKEVEWSSESSAELQSSLSKLEQHLANTLSLIQIRGKRGRIVPVLLTPDVKSIMILLHETRTSVGINPANDYFFARPYFSSLTHIRGSDCLRETVNKINLERPDLVRSTRLRKYVATVSQVFNLDERQVDWLARHLGHDLTVHRNYYRLHESALELTKVSKILLAVDKGIVHKFEGKNIDDMSLEDLFEDPEVNAACEEDEKANDENSSDDETTGMNLFGTQGCHEEFGGLGPNETTFDPETKITSCPASFDSTQEDKDKSITNIQHRPRAKISERMTWTEPQRKNALHFFKKEISNCKVPGKERCTEFIGNNPDLKHIHWKKVKQFVHNYLNKIRKKLN